MMNRVHKVIVAFVPLFVVLVGLVVIGMMAASTQTPKPEFILRRCGEGFIMTNEHRTGRWLRIDGHDDTPLASDADIQSLCDGDDTVASFLARRPR
jgi:lipoprotein-anchoring transpeptidase ErfK/SrfK